MPAPSSAPIRILAIGAHPDDVEFGCGATLAKWAAGGCEIFHLVCTDGSKGSWDPSEDTARLVRFLLSEEGSWINGQLLHSNGGFRSS